MGLARDAAARLCPHSSLTAVRSALPALSILGGRSGHPAGTWGLCKKAMLCKAVVRMGCWCFHEEGFRKARFVSWCFLQHFCLSLTATSLQGKEEQSRHCIKAAATPSCPMPVLHG